MAGGMTTATTISTPSQESRFGAGRRLHLADHADIPEGRRGAEPMTAAHQARVGAHAMGEDDHDQRADPPEVRDDVRCPWRRVCPRGLASRSRTDAPTSAAVAP